MCAYQVFQWLSVPYLFAGYYTVIILRYVFLVELCCCPYHCDLCFRPPWLRRTWLSGRDMGNTNLKSALCGHVLFGSTWK